MNSDHIILSNFIRHHPTDAARILERLKTEDAALFLSEISTSHAVRIFGQLERYTAAKCLEMLDAELTAAILEQLPLSVVSILLRRLKSELRNEVLELVADDVSKPLRRMLNYPEDSAGALADPEVLTFAEDLVVKEALQRLQKRPEKAIYYLYIVNRNHTLTGVITLRELMLSPPGDMLSAAMHPEVVYLSAELDFQAILNHSGWQDFHALPVVDRNGMLLGVVPYETLRRVEKESQKSRVPKHALTASAALGELYRIGLSSLVQSATIPLSERQQKK